LVGRALGVRVALIDEDTNAFVGSLDLE
jgi:hypothetical protein